MKELLDLHEQILKCRKCIDVYSLSMPGYIGDNYFDDEFKILFVGRNPGQSRDYKDYSTEHHDKEMTLEEFNKSYLEGLQRCNIGKFLVKIFDSLDIKFSDIAFINIIKCTTKNNSELTDVQLENCSMFLEKQITLLNPSIIVALGNAAYLILRKKYSSRFTIIHSFHPAYFRYKGINDDAYSITIASEIKSKKEIMLGGLNKYLK